MKRLEVQTLYDLSHTRLGESLKKCTYPWEILSCLSEEISALGKTLSQEEFSEISPQVWVAKDARIAPSATVSGPCIIDRGAELRPGAYVRGNVIIGKDAVVGNSTEVKNAVVFDGVQIPHFNYVGDSVLGYKSHLGAGAVCSNVKSDKTPVTVRLDGEKIPTGRKKFGAMLGDFTEVGCNCVLCPGTVTGKKVTVYPLSRVRGYLPENHIFKNAECIVEKTKESEET